MRFIKCGSKLFRPDTVTAVDLASGSAKADVLVALPNCGLTFQGPEAEAVRAFFSRIPATDLLRRDEPEATEQVAANHSRGEC
jgi:hypothetical protein